MDYKLEIKPAINPKTRHKIEDLLEEARFLIHGGGQYINGDSCDITFSREDQRSKDK